MTLLKMPISKFIVVGYSTRQHLLIDLDNTTLSKTLKLVKLIMNNYPNVGDCLVVLSSVLQHKERWIYTQEIKPTKQRILDNYHLIFDNRIGYNTCDRILKDLVGIGVIPLIADKLRGLRSCMTLRVSPKIMMIGTRPCPKPRFIIHSIETSRYDGGIDKYLRCLDTVKECFYRWLKPYEVQVQHQTPTLQ